MREAILTLISMEPIFSTEVYNFLESKVKLKRNESLKREIARNSSKISPESRERLLGILESDGSSIVKSLVLSARTR
jgi:hypothetical protein